MEKYSINSKLKSQEKSNLFLTCLASALAEAVYSRGDHLITSATSPDGTQQNAPYSSQFSSCNDNSIFNEAELKKVFNSLTSLNMDHMTDLNDQSEPENKDYLITNNQKSLLYTHFDTSMQYIKYLLLVKKNPNVHLTSFNQRYNEWIFFNIIFNWFYHPRMGFYVFKLFKNTIKSEHEKAFFKDYFLQTQVFYDDAFSRKSGITSATCGLAGLFFDEAILNRTIRLLVYIYNPSFWAALKPNQKFLFVTALIKKVRKEARYDAINQLFEPISANPSQKSSDSKGLLNEKVHILPISTVSEPKVDIKSSSEPAAFKKYLTYFGVASLICASIANMPRKDVFFASLTQPQLIRIDTPQSSRPLPFAALSVLAAAKNATGKMVSTSSKEAVSKASSGLVKTSVNSLDNPVLLFGSQFLTNLKDSSSLLGSPRDPAFAHSLEDGFENPALLFGSELIANLKDSISAPASPRGVFGHSLLNEPLYSEAMSKGLALIKQKETVVPTKEPAEAGLSFSFDKEFSKKSYVQKNISVLPLTPVSPYSGAINWKAPKINLRLSRQPKQRIMNLAVRDLKEQNRKVVTAFLPFNPFKASGNVSPDVPPYKMYAHIVDYQNNQEIQKIIELEIAPTMSFEELKTALYEKTLLGAQLPGSIKMTRDLHMDCHFVDSQNKNMAFSTIPVNYNEAKSTVIKKTAGAQVSKALEQLRMYFNEISLDGAPRQEKNQCNAKKLYPLLLNQKSKATCLDTNGALLLPPYHAAHFATNQITKALDFDHGTLGTNYTDQAFNGTSVYDNKDWNEINWLGDFTKPLSHALTEGFQDKFDSISDYANDFDDKRLALCVASVVDDTYTSTRSLMAETVTETALKPYAHREGELPQQFINVVSRIRAAMLHCRSNNTILEEKFEAVLVPLKNPVISYETNSNQNVSTKTMQSYSRFIKMPKDIIEQNLLEKDEISSKKTRKKDTHPTMRELSKDLRSLKTTLKTMEINFVTQQTLCLQACLTHCLLMDKTEHETEAFIKHAFNYLTSERRDKNLARKDDSDSKLLTFFNTCGLSFHEALNSSDDYLLSLEGLLKEGLSKFESEIHQISSTRNQASELILSKLEETKTELESAIDTTLSLSQKISSLKLYALTLPQKSCADLYSSCVSDSWGHTLALVKNSAQKFKQLTANTNEKHAALLEVAFSDSLKELTESSYFKFGRQLSLVVTSNGYNTKEIVSERQKPFLEEAHRGIQNILNKTETSQSSFSPSSSKVGQISESAASSSNSKQLLLEPTPYSRIDLETAVESTAKQAKPKPRLASLPAEAVNSKNISQKSRDVRFASAPIKFEQSVATFSKNTYKPIKRRINQQIQQKLTYDGSTTD